MEPSPYKNELVRIASEEHETFASVALDDPPMQKRIEHYCHDLGLPVTQSVREHYSAVFISWCIRTAGASKGEFPAAVSHSQYARRCIEAAKQAKGLFRARRMESYAPQPGDIVHVNRLDGTVNYDTASASEWYPAESGIVVELGESEAIIVMGNQEPRGNVGTEKLPLTPSGLLVQRAEDPIICVIEVLK